VGLNRIKEINPWVKRFLGRVVDQE
jgi:hypothetical protein